MNLNSTTTKEQIRKIEDIIDIQKANGNFATRQVAFNIPEVGNVSAKARSLESGLSKTDGEKVKKTRVKHHKCPNPDVISWPSDSDITVLRMKLCLASDLKKSGNDIAGDGLHQPDSSSMVNLATLMRKSQPPSKHSLIEEYLVPLTSWDKEPLEKSIIKGNNPIVQLGHKLDNNNSSKLKCNNKCEMSSEASTKCKIARFLRLYFCPCCRCLYKMENLSDDPSTYWEKRREQKL